MIVGGVLLAISSLSGASRIETLGVTALDCEFIAALVLSITFCWKTRSARVLVGAAGPNRMSGYTLLSLHSIQP